MDFAKSPTENPRDSGPAGMAGMAGIDTVRPGALECHSNPGDISLHRPGRGLAFRTPR
jgi:hypothetical protein